MPFFLGSARTASESFRLKILILIESKCKSHKKLSSVVEIQTNEASSVFFLLGEFAETLVKEAVFLLNDALGRLADVHGRQEEMADGAWAKQPAAQRADKASHANSRQQQMIG